MSQFVPSTTLLCPFHFPLLSLARSITPSLLTLVVFYLLQVGFHGQDVDQMIKDLVEMSLTLTRKKEAAKLKDAVATLVEDRLIAVSAREVQTRDCR